MIVLRRAFDFKNIYEFSLFCRLLLYTFFKKPLLTKLLKVIIFEERKRSKRVVLVAKSNLLVIKGKRSVFEQFWKAHA